LKPKKTDKRLSFWRRHCADDEIIIKLGFLDKQRHLLSTKKRMFLITFSPARKSKSKEIWQERLHKNVRNNSEKHGFRIHYYTQKGVYKGDIPVSKEMHVPEISDNGFQNFVLDTPGRIYRLADNQSMALHWRDKIKEVWQRSCRIEDGQSMI